MTHNTYKISPESRNGKFREASCATKIHANNKYQAPATRIVGYRIRDAERNNICNISL